MTDNAIEARELLLRAQPIVERFTRYARARGEYFNIFEILDRTTDEVKGHSAFIAELLDPKGSHGQGTMFLNLFLKCFKLGPNIPPDQQSNPQQMGGSWKVWTEYTIPEEKGNTDTGGRIDIVIEGPDCLIVIENKIYAPDAYHQLERYNEFAKEQRKSQVVIAYLTLDGRNPTDKSRGNLKPEDIRLLNYKDDIKDWLEACIKTASRLPAIRETLCQYLSLVNKLATGSFNREIAMEIANAITSAASFTAAQEIATAVVEVKVKTLQKFFKELEERLSAKVKYPELDQNSFLPWPHYMEEARKYYEKSRRCFGIGFTLGNLSNDLQVAFVVEVHEHLYYGLRLVSTKEEANINQVPEQCKKLLEMMQDIDSDFKEEKPSLIAWRFTQKRKKLRWWDFDEACQKLIDDGELKKFVEELTGEIVSVINDAAEKCKELFL